MRIIFLRSRTGGAPIKGERGTSLLETTIALALLGIIAVALLSAVATTSSARSIADEQVTARVLAESQVEDIRQRDYAFSYELSPPGPEYAGYSTLIDVDNMRNGNIQKLTITVRHHNKEILNLQSYKANR
jgi:type II secretory pathway pseudopilin PulG